MTESLETCISGEDKDLNLHNNLTFDGAFTMLCLKTSHKGSQHLLSLARDGIEGGGLHHLGSYSVFLGLSHECRR